MGKTSKSLQYNRLSKNGTPLVWYLKTTKGEVPVSFETLVRLGNYWKNPELVKEELAMCKTLGERDDAALRDKQMQAYLTLQDAAGFTLGCRAEVMYEVPDGTCGWSDVWTLEMSYMIGESYIVTRISNKGIELDRGFEFPFFVLKNLGYDDKPGMWYKKEGSSELFTLVRYDSKDGNVYYHLISVSDGKLIISDADVNISKAFIDGRELYTQVSISIEDE